MHSDSVCKTIVIAGAGYAGLHVAQRLGAWLQSSREWKIALVDHHDYHQVLTELPHVAAGLRPEEKVRIPVSDVLPDNVEFSETEITGFDLARPALLTNSGNMDFWRLVVALGSRPNDFAIPGLAEHVLFMWSSDDAVTVRRAVEESVRKAAQTSLEEEQRRLLTVVIGGGGATGVELAGAFAEELPVMARRYGANPALCTVVILDAGHTILGDSSPELIAKAQEILAKLGVHVMTNSTIAEASDSGLKLKSGATIHGGTYIWAGGVKAPDLIRNSGLEIGYNGRIKVDRYLRAIDHPDVYAAGDVASVPDPSTGMALPPLAQTALAEGETVAQNINREASKRDLEPFNYRQKGIVVSVGAHRGAATVSGVTFGGRLAHALKEAIEWEYRQSVQHLRGWSPTI